MSCIERYELVEKATSLIKSEFDVLSHPCLPCAPERLPPSCRGILFTATGEGYATNGHWLLRTATPPGFIEESPFMFYDYDAEEVAFINPLEDVCGIYKEELDALLDRPRRYTVILNVADILNVIDIMPSIKTRRRSTIFLIPKTGEHMDIILLNKKEGVVTTAVSTYGEDYFPYVALNVSYLHKILSLYAEENKEEAIITFNSREYVVFEDIKICLAQSY